MNSHQRRKSRRAVERGYGPRHAFNAQEGDELVPEELPSPPAEDLRVKRNSMGNLRPAMLAKALGQELGSLSKEDVAKLGISLLIGGEGPREPSLPPSAKPKQPGLKLPDFAPRYEGPPEAPKPGSLEHLKSIQEPFDPYAKKFKPPKDWNKFLELNYPNMSAEEKAHFLKTHEESLNPEGWTTEQDQSEFQAKYDAENPPDNTFPSLNKPPYDALKEPEWDPMTGLAPGKKFNEDGEIVPEEPPEQKYTHWLGDPVPKKPGSDSFGDMTPQDKADLQKFHDDMAKKFPPDKIQNDEPPSDSISHLKGQEWLDAYMKKLDEAGLVEPGAQEKQDALDALDLPPAEDPPGAPSDWQQAKDFLLKNQPPEEPPSEPNAYYAAKDKHAAGEPLSYDEASLLHNVESSVHEPDPDLLSSLEEMLLKNKNLDRNAGSQGFSEGFKRGTTGVRHNPKTKTGRPKKIGVDPGFGPRHAANAKEGEDLTQVNTDTVPAMLTPREAVLNRNAAELAGRGNIEELNQQGNELAKQGVDLASGESNVPDPKAGDRRLAGTGAASYLTRELYEKYGGSPTAFELVPDFVKYLEQESDPTMAQRGTANMKPKSKLPPSKPKPSGKPAPPPSGSPYVQGFQNLMPQGLQGGGYADAMPGLQNRDFPHPMAGQMHPQGLQPLIPPGGMTGGPEPVQQNRNFPHPNAGLMHPGGAYLGQPGIQQQPGALGGGGSNWMPGLSGGTGEPPGAYGVQPFQGPQGLKGLGSGSFFPKGGQGYADGTTDVTPPIGAANTSAAYGPPIQLTAPDISKLLQSAGQQQGLTSSQIAGLAKAFQSFGGGAGGAPGSGGDLPYDQLGGQYASFSGGYQGGISDIGYPPMIAPDAEYDPYRAGWIGQYNPERMIPRYARGSDDVGNFAANPELFYGPEFKFSGSGFHGGGGFSNRSSFNPAGSFSGAPGFPWSPTKIPTTYDPQGYPYGVPVQGPDQNVQGVGRTHNLRSNQ